MHALYQTLASVPRGVQLINCRALAVYNKVRLCPIESVCVNLPGL
jgi:hypothetical protein